MKHRHAGEGRHSVNANIPLLDAQFGIHCINVRRYRLLDSGARRNDRFLRYRFQHDEVIHCLLFPIYYSLILMFRFFSSASMRFSSETVSFSSLS